jgi:GntR family hexuronate regulon transcriptional repressor
VTKQDIMKLMEIQENARKEKCFRDSEWDLQFHVQVALATQNTALAAIVEKMWTQRVHNPYWKNCTTISIPAPSTTGVTITIKSLKR